MKGGGSSVAEGLAGGPLYNSTPIEMHPRGPIAATVVESVPDLTVKDFVVMISLSSAGMADYTCRIGCWGSATSPVGVAAQKLPQQLPH